MDSAPAFALGLPGYAVHRLWPEDAESLQQLLDRCSDYALLVEGEVASPTAGQDLFREVPPGKQVDDKFVLGIVDGAGRLIGLLEGVRGYPEAAVWWIGLLLLAPEARGHGIGRQLLADFSQYARTQGAAAIMLGVVEENVRAYRFWQQVGFRLVRQTEPRRFGKKAHSVYVLKWTLAEEQTM